MKRCDLKLSFTALYGHALQLLYRCIIGVLERVLSSLVEISLSFSGLYFRAGAGKIRVNTIPKSGLIFERSQRVVAGRRDHFYKEIKAFLCRGE